MATRKPANMAISAEPENEALLPYEFIERQNDIGNIDISSSRLNNNALNNITTATTNVSTKRKTEEMATCTEQDNGKKGEELHDKPRDLCGECRAQRVRA